MKKILITISLLIVVILSGCANTPQEDYITREEYNALEVRVDVVEDRFNNLIVSVGINEQISLYENDAVPEDMFLSISTFTYLSTEKDYLEKSKFPDYIWDLDGEYISVNDLGDLLTQKYLGINSETTIGYQYSMKVYQPSGMSNEEYMAKLSMMILELSHYDFYSIDSPELYIQFNSFANAYMKVRMSLLVSDKYDLHPAIFYNGLMDTRIYGFSYDNEIVETLYNQYLLSGEYDGFVLDYN